MALEALTEIEDTLHELSDSQHYHLLKHHSQPCKNYVFPSQFEGGCNPSFQIGWLEEFPWLVYSSALDEAFCITCALFANPRSGLGILVNKPFIKWRKKLEHIGLFQKISTPPPPPYGRQEIHKFPQNFINFNRNSRKTIQSFVKFWNSSRF